MEFVEGLEHVFLVGQAVGVWRQVLETFEVVVHGSHIGLSLEVCGHGVLDGEEEVRFGGILRTGTKLGAEVLLSDLEELGVGEDLRSHEWFPLDIYGVYVSPLFSFPESSIVLSSNFQYPIKPFSEFFILN